MMNRWWLAAGAIALSILQAWDSNALDAEAPVKAIVGAGVILPALAIGLTGDWTVRLVAVGVAVVLLFAARAVSSVAMPELALAAVFPGILMLLDRFASLQRRAAARHGKS